MRQERQRDLKHCVRVSTVVALRNQRISCGRIHVKAARRVSASLALEPHCRDVRWQKEGARDSTPRLDIAGDRKVVAAGDTADQAPCSRLRLHGRRAGARPALRAGPCGVRLEIKARKSAHADALPGRGARARATITKDVEAATCRTGVHAVSKEGGRATSVAVRSEASWRIV